MYTPKMMATVHAMGSRKKAEGGVSLSGAPIRRDRGYTGRPIRSQYPRLSRGSIFRVRNKKDARPRDHFDDTDVISTILDPFAEIRLKLVSLQSSFSH